MENRENNIPVDARLLSEAIIELNIARRNVSIYPPGHPAIEGSIKRALEKLDNVFSLRKHITLAVSGDALVVDGQRLDEKNAVLKEFASHLHGLGISHITFKKGITGDELLRFNEKILSRSKREDTLTRAELENLKKELKHVEVGLIDFDLLRVETGEVAETETGEGLWDRYIYGLLSGTLAPEEAEPVITVIPPTTLAKILNEASEKGSFSEKNYEKVITSYLHRSSGRDLASEDVKKMVMLINSLSPELKTHFLSMTVQNFPQRGEELERALKDLSPEEVERFISLLETQSAHIPDTLKNLISKFSQVDESLNELGFIDDKFLLDDLLLKEEMAVLLEKGRFHDFVTDDYDREIKKILEFQPPQESTAREKTGPLPSEEEIERDHLEILLELIAGSDGDEESYRNLIASITSRILSLNEAGDLRGVLEGIEFLMNESQKGKFPEIAEGKMEKLAKGNFPAALVNTLRLVGRRERDSSLKLVTMLGDKLIPDLLDALSEEEDSAVRRFLIDLLSTLGERVASEAAKRLDDTRWFVVRNMLHLIYTCGSREQVEAVKPFLEHPDDRVKVEAFRCLLKHGDPEAKRKLIEHLRTPREAFFHHAMDLAGKFRVTEAAEEICSFLLKKATTGSDFEAKKIAVRALAEIGYPGAIRAYREILKEKSILFKGSLDSLKETVFLHLKYFPFEQVREMVTWGLKSRSETVRRECARMLKKEGGEKG